MDLSRSGDNHLVDSKGADKMCFFNYYWAMKMNERTLLL